MFLKNWAKNVWKMPWRERQADKLPWLCHPLWVLSCPSAYPRTLDWTRIAFATGASAESHLQVCSNLGVMKSRCMCMRLGADCLKLLRYPTKNFKESWTTTCIRNNFGVMIDFFLSCLVRWPSSCQLHLERCSQSHSKRHPASQVVCAFNSRPKLQAKPWCLGKTHV